MEDVGNGVCVSAVKLIMVKENTQIYFKDRKLNSAEQVVEAVQSLFKNYDREIFVVLALDAKANVISWEIIAIGGTTFCPVDVKNIFKHVLLSNGVAVVCLHNHVSGNPKPSRADYEITQKIRAAAEVLDIRVFDHIVIGEERTYSVMSSFYT